MTRTLDGKNENRIKTNEIKTITIGAEKKRKLNKMIEEKTK